MARGSKPTDQGVVAKLPRSRKRVDTPANGSDADSGGGKRTYLKQSDVPNAAIDDAVRLPQAIFDHYAGKPTAPFGLARALDIDPKGSQLKLLSGAAIAFGLIEGGAQAATITPTELARRIIRPRTEDEDLAAKREAVLKPRVFGEFLRQYDGHPFPRQDIAVNILEGLGVPRAKAQEVLERVTDSARSVGFLVQIKGKPYVTLNPDSAQASAGERSAEPRRSEQDADESDEEGSRNAPEPVTAAPLPMPTPAIHSRGAALSAAIADDHRRRRVFVTHGKDRGLVEPIKKLLEYGELEPVVSVDRQSVSKPVPEKVMDDMRGAGAAIIHVDADQTITDVQGNEHVLLNPNVLIEIGAAMAFYGRRFILLVREGVKLPRISRGSMK